MIRYNGYVIGKEGFWLKATKPPLPPFTIRLKFMDGVTPTFRRGTAVQVSSSPNIWDLTYENTSWNELLIGQLDLLEVIDVNTAGVSDMSDMFTSCTSLTTVPLFDTSNVTNMNGMFRYCTALTNIPLFNTSSATGMVQMFYDCRNVQSGALDLYQQASTQATIPVHGQAFKNCGIDNIDGFYEWEQIPDDWK